MKLKRRLLIFTNLTLLIFFAFFIYSVYFPEKPSTEPPTLEDYTLMKRQALINFLWREEGFPYKRMPDSVEFDVDDDKFSNITNLKQIDRISVIMDYGITSTFYHFHPIESNNKLMVYHHGHQGDFSSASNTIGFFVENGYSVMAFDMPMTGRNNRPTIELETGEEIQLDHNKLKFLKSKDGSSPVKFFVEPVAIGLNYAEKFNYDSVSMIGLSGGGWTTVLYSAIDPRVYRSYPVAGSLPLVFRNTDFNPLHANAEFGDYEQNLPELYYGIADYTDLYILGSYGDGRLQLQIFNENDPCCFSDGDRSLQYMYYVKYILNSLGKGSFDVWTDSSHNEHKISDVALSFILKEELKHNS